MAEKESDLLCIGNALVDVFARDEGQLAGRFGILNPVQHIEIGRLNEVLSALTEKTVVSGGGAANVAKIAAFLGLKTCFTGAIGARNTNEPHHDFVPDRFGGLFNHSLSEAGVSLKLSLKSSPTGIFLMLQIPGSDLSDKGKTRIIASPSAACELSEADIDEEDIRNAGIVVIDGFMWDRPHLIRHIFKQADRYGKVCALDLGSTFIAEEHSAEIAEYACQHSLILFMNEAEAHAFHKAQGFPGDLYGFFSSLTGGRSFPVFVVKLGERGAMCFAKGQIIHAETEAVVPREVTGAGDAFCAGFLSAWVRNKSIPECADIGNRTARIVLDGMGTQADRDHFKKIAARIK